MFPSKDAPRFRKATILDISLFVISLSISLFITDLTFLHQSSVGILVFSMLNVLCLYYATRQKQTRRTELLAPYVKNEDPDAPLDGGDKAWTELGDKHPDFRYAI